MKSWNVVETIDIDRPAVQEVGERPGGKQSRYLLGARLYVGMCLQRGLHR